MHVLVVGAGIIGSIYGWALAESGHYVVHLVRSGRAGAFRDGLPLDVFDRRKGHERNFRGLYRQHAVEMVSPTDTFELVIVPVKHYALVQTLKEVVPKVGAAEFLLLTQNWRGTDDIDSILPRSRYIYGDAKAGGAFSEGTLVAALKGIDIGSPEGEPSALARRFEGLFASADIPTRLHSDMLYYLWIQYAITGGLWAALMQAGNLDAMLNDPEATSAALRAACECVEVVKRRGAVLSRYPETKPFLTNSALRKRVNLWMTCWMFRHDEYTKRCSSHAFGDPVEVTMFYDDLITTGRDLGVSMPVMDSYADSIRRFAMTAQRMRFPSCVGWGRRGACEGSGLIHGRGHSSVQRKVLHNLPLPADLLHHNQVLSKMNDGTNKQAFSFAAASSRERRPRLTGFCLPRPCGSRITKLQDAPQLGLRLGLRKSWCFGTRRFAICPLPLR
jgi:2-dehydropantoate 2-reductase